MRKIGIFTTSRAEFGIFSALLRQIESNNDLKYILFVGGSHLVKEFGKTINEIKDKFKISEIFDFLLNEDSNYSLTRSLGIELIELANIFRRYYFDFCCILGDRFELLPIVLAAVIFKKPIIHLHGGEVSQGAIDEQIRHMVTKAAHVHFVSCEEYKQNIRKMGEPEWRIFNTGALSADNMAMCLNIDRATLFSKLRLNDKKKTILMTYHPATLEYKITPNGQIKSLLKALEEFDLQVVITSPNIETGRDIIISVIQEEVNNKENYHYIESLGEKLYHSLIPHCEFVIGNSSSGIVEVPFFKIPTVNIGDRQKGRLRHESVVDTGYSVESIRSGIEKALSQDFRERIKTMKYRFGDGKAAKMMVEIIKSIEIDEKLMRKELDFPNE